MKTSDYRGDTRTSKVIYFCRSKEGPSRSQVHRPRATTPFLRSWKANPSFPLLTLFFAIPVSPSLPLLSSLFLLCQNVPTQFVHILSLKEPSSNRFSFVEALSFFHSFIYLWIPPLFQLFATLRYCYLVRAKYRPVIPK
ncbi:hypothetical protein BDV30DRAFT_229335 [Aspergillus minisclerotigenes]|uniref:Transmembrane protein n=1 Tax=Aspergillus minisclerotigenes TaxID=656917 RepID=A0A5N6IUD8_9EURO|nr:hypothetical protein BDV30DRAFT_229335 [Aspergillus minisclerotigenes]